MVTLNSIDNYSSSTLTRHLINKMTKIETLQLSNEYLFHLLKYSLIVQMLSKQIKSLHIRFSINRLIFEDLIRISNVFATN